MGNDDKMSQKDFARQMTNMGFTNTRAFSPFLSAHPRRNVPNKSTPALLAAAQNRETWPRL